jgi:integrase
MGTADFAAALAKAGTWFEDRNYEIRKGTFVPPSSAKFEKLIEPMLAHLAARGRSEAYVRGVRLTLGPNSYLRRFFGKMAVDRVTSRSWDDFRVWIIDERTKLGKPHLHEKSLHQMKNAVSWVLKEAYRQRLIDVRPRFEDPLKNKTKDNRPRTRFGDDEYNQLLVACAETVDYHRSHKTRWIGDAEEMLDFVRFMRATGMRVGECRGLRFSDVQVLKDRAKFGGKVHEVEVCLIRVTKGKTGAHPPFRSEPWAVGVFQNILKRRGVASPASCDLPLFQKHHRDMLRETLKRHGLHDDGYGRKRDAVSLRHTYICAKLEEGVPVHDVAKNTRTSMAVIEQHYARDLPVSGELINRYSFSLDVNEMVEQAAGIPTPPPSRGLKGWRQKLAAKLIAGSDTNPS